MDAEQSIKRDKARVWRFFCYYANFIQDSRYETIPTISKMQFHLAALEFHRIVYFPCSLSILSLQQYCWSLLVSSGCAANWLLRCQAQ